MLSSILLCSICVLSTPGQDSAKSSRATPPLSSNHYPDGVADESAYADWLVKRNESMQQVIKQATAPTRARQLAHHANWILAVRSEPHATRLLLGAHRPEDLTALESFGTDALLLLTQATEHWPDDDADHVEQLALLSHCGRAMALVARAKMGRHDQAAAQEVFEELAVWSDEDDEHIAAAALLWQSVLAHEYGKTDRALKAMPLSLAPLPAGVADFYLRVLRCRLLANTGRTTLALALILKMEERCPQWFSNETDQDHAICTLTWLRLQIAGASEPNLNAFSQTLRKEWLARAEDLLKDQESPCRLLRLGKAVPMLFAEPKQRAAIAAPAGSQPQLPTPPSGEQPGDRDSAPEKD